MIDEAVAAGARRKAACELLGLTARTVKRWRDQATMGAMGRTRKFLSDRGSDPRAALSLAKEWLGDQALRQAGLVVEVR